MSTTKTTKGEKTNREAKHSLSEVRVAEVSLVNKAAVPEASFLIAKKLDMETVEVSESVMPDGSVQYVEKAVNRAVKPTADLPLDDDELVDESKDGEATGFAAPESGESAPLKAVATDDNDETEDAEDDVDDDEDDEEDADDAATADDDEDADKEDADEGREGEEDADDGDDEEIEIASAISDSIESLRSVSHKCGPRLLQILGDLIRYAVEAFGDEDELSDLADSVTVHNPTIHKMLFEQPAEPAQSATLLGEVESILRSRELLAKSHSQKQVTDDGTMAVCQARASQLSEQLRRINDRVGRLTPAAT